MPQNVNVVSRQRYWLRHHSGRIVLGTETRGVENWDRLCLTRILDQITRFVEDRA